MYTYYLQLYVSSYKEIKWDSHRHSICPLDEYSPVTNLQVCGLKLLVHEALSY